MRRGYAGCYGRAVSTCSGSTGQAEVVFDASVSEVVYIEAACCIAYVRLIYGLVLMGDADGLYEIFMCFQAIFILLGNSGAGIVCRPLRRDKEVCGYDEIPDPAASSHKIYPCC